MKFVVYFLFAIALLIVVLYIDLDIWLWWKVYDLFTDKKPKLRSLFYKLWDWIDNNTLTYRRDGGKEKTMIICNDCGHVFAESEWGDYGECPSCNSTDTDEARECQICGEYHNGFFEGHTIWCCPECFQKALTAENFLKYATSGAEFDKPDVLEDFIMYEVFDLDQELRFSSLAFKEHCHNIYQDLAKSGTVGDLIKDYFERVPDTYSDFTDWMVKVHNGESTKVV